MAKFQSILETVGNTPLVRMPGLTRGLGAELWFKLEFFNPLGSVKDRIARAMIEEAEIRGELGAGFSVLEPTSGNTGIGLAFVCAAKGYPLTLVMPETMSQERRTLLLMLGAEIVLTPGALGMKGAIAKSLEMLGEHRARGSRVWMPRQFENADNPHIHFLTTGPEIWQDTEGKVDGVVAGVGTGGTFTGVGMFLKSRKPSVRMIAVEPVESQVLSGGKPGPHKIQGIGAGFVPANFDRSLLDGIETVTSEEALSTAKRVIREEGVPAGISSGAAIAAALRLGARPEWDGKTLVVMLASHTERYLSTLLGEEARTQAQALLVQPVEEEALRRAGF